ncbi:bifunctional [glutamate--ammonia ligase]-adenylyl-L-tyrosine phosphorylase/[glutamate--ammonia-ligase] adenylyltransferase [Marinomonas mediterranea]|uniref:Bifunctional glutamine synthetase adenylyltransferase/adenylyl-removing enzyme n=1 Tax=Marinomonas mediterranea (strain ATCC 700492 / JCM 21426 / NBRC 103028 / MMB-1) TaxID=717774 RepID=F2K3Q5_MARM1|nr:bifunctional [glutamate--ammonia ligase]-adenylyl-L-tyrosine phosphorylase/[glutamate--ammonia-ligase] adenylyltransferase [Marinomonas mediterranea]ADZ90154.1 Glutamate-ammonia-ligase adenylyltransferase [Marinomonas mediterranea MMB-1]
MSLSHLSSALDVVPDTLKSLKYEQILDAQKRSQVLFSSDDERLRYERLWLLSDYLHIHWERNIKWMQLDTNLDELKPDLSHFYVGHLGWSAGERQTALPDWDEPTLMRQLRLYRHWWMTQLISADMEQRISLERLTYILSRLADVTVNASLSWSERNYKDLYGEALDANGEKQSLVVIGMGKLGGQELNLSSDIDLIFAFREHGETQQGRKSISYQEYFTKIGQKLIQHLDQVTADGFVFRVDMRLRPFGQSGALVLNMDSLENYYQDQGRDWERYAMIKARVMAGSEQDITEFEAIRKPFVYRKYLDFGAIGALRDLKGMIAKEVRRKGIEHNIKLGEGGIREIEFVVQALQILHGGRDTRLQTPSIYKVLPYLKEADYLPADEVNELLEAYRYLRRVEHALQSVKDEQTQLLPDDDFERQRLAVRVGEANWDELEATLWCHRKNVHRYFVELIDDPEEEAESDSSETWRLLLKRPDQQHLFDLVLDEVQWNDLSNVESKIRPFLSSKTVAYMQPIGQERLAQFMGMFFPLLAEDKQGKGHNPDIVLERVIPILEAIARRTAYLVLLCENKTAIKHLIRLCRESAWFSESISTTPALLDELLDATTLFLPPNKAELEEELSQILLRLPEDDEEAQMDALRRFRRSIILRIAACDITGVLPVMKVSDHLTWLAEVILDVVLRQSWHHLVHKHGYPTKQGEAVSEPEMIVVGYGKSGGLELGYDSDLDLVFIHNSDINGSTNGQRSVDNLTFYTRFGQRIIHMLTSFTSAGRLYEVDMRLRPSGNSGLLVSSLDAFTDYQEKEAWVWEHQALTRARVLAGPHNLAMAFEKARHTTLSKERDQSELKQEVIKMREKMRAHLDKGSGASGFDLKQGQGGIIDIEFMVQYLVLAWSYKHPELMTYSDNVRQIDVANKLGLLEDEVAQKMTETYTLYRSLTHRQSLQKQGRVVQLEELEESQGVIRKIWDRELT